MVFATFELRAKRAWMYRARLIIQMLTTTAYGSLGLAFADPIFKGSPITMGHFLAVAVGLLCGYVALYLAPQGEGDD